MCFLCYDTVNTYIENTRFVLTAFMKWYVRRVIYNGIAYLVIRLPISALIPSICGCVYCTRLNFSSYMQFIYNCFVTRQF